MARLIEFLVVDEDERVEIVGEIYRFSRTAAITFNTFSERKAWGKLREGSDPTLLLRSVSDDSDAPFPLSRVYEAVRDLLEEVPVKEAETEAELERLAMPIGELGLSVRVENLLKRNAGIFRVGEVLERLARGDAKLLAIPDFGPKALAELKEKLVACGFELPKAEEG